MRLTYMCSVHQKKNVSTLTCVTLCAGRYSPSSGLPGGLPQHGGRAWPPWGCGQAVKGQDGDLDQHVLFNVGETKITTHLGMNCIYTTYKSCDLGGGILLC